MFWLILLYVFPALITSWVSFFGVRSRIREDRKLIAKGIPPRHLTWMTLLAHILLPAVPLVNWLWAANWIIDQLQRPVLKEPK